MDKWLIRTNSFAVHEMSQKSISLFLHYVDFDMQVDSELSNGILENS